MNKDELILAFSALGSDLASMADLLSKPDPSEKEDEYGILKAAILSYRENPWFTHDNISSALYELSVMLNEDSLRSWIHSYEPKINYNSSSKTVGLINAGNIPLAGFHDFLCVLMSGHSYQGKNSTTDRILLPFVANKLVELIPEIKNRITFSEKLSNFDAVIATGSNNSSRYFEYYFSKYPHIIRKNRNGIAVLDGEETEEDLKNMSDDIFRYFGLGCRNVSKIYFPEGFNLDRFFQSLYHWSSVMSHHKYMNNFEHHNAVLLLKKVSFLQNGFIILMEDASLASPVAVLHYEFYSEKNRLFEKLSASSSEIQCIVSARKGFFTHPDLEKISVRPGKTQSPKIGDYADGVDTMEFLLGL
ncbi:MAG: acyl-CoA reductase [Bacteroidetes bacterium]|nr:MAG: acyl-CoA reductase [Bacteroidota bacterium]REJ99756.1 MAG: acyl-CoA reductase [Bacteroidota bacterium]REK34129.1 MAG: acyl-CoA reductase [Bacteroidota bacterium]REK50460.1 MAG: acyl-CoA reductase [Bacteroidota bacterium]